MWFYDGFQPEYLNDF
jgi:hypothetical protein